MKDKIPFPIVNRSKKGFGIPLAKWLRKELCGFARDVLSESEIKKGGLFEHRYIQHILAEHQEGKQNHRKLIWSLIVFQMWRKRWGTGI